MNRQPSHITAEARVLIDVLASSTDPMAFQALLDLSQYIGICLGTSARTLAEAQSWSSVADLAGTTKQAAWSRWHH